MSKTRNLFQSSSLSKADTKNQEGAPAFTLPMEERLMNCVTLGTFEPTFYSSAHDIMESTLKTFMEAREKDPIFLAKALVYGSEKGCIEDAPILGLLVLSAGNDKCKALSRSIFRRIIRTPKQLAKFLTMARGGKIRGMGRLIKGLTSDFLNNLSPIHVIKYGSSGREFSLFNMFQLVHAKCDPKTLEIRQYLKDGSIEQLSSKWSQVLGYNDFLRTKDIKLISKHNLPYEVVTAQASTREAWEALIKGDKIPYQWLLKNLNNLQKYGCLDDKRLRAKVCSLLRSQELIKASKQVPHKIYTAIINLSNAHRDVLDALHSALDDSISNIGSINGNTLVAIDSSASMTYSSISERSVMLVADVAALFGASLYKSSLDVDVVLFDTKVNPVSDVSSVSTIADITKAFRRKMNGCGTDFSVVTKHIHSLPKDYDNIIYITDGEDWVNNSRSSATDLIDRYRAKRRKDLKVLQVLVTPQSTTRISPNHANTFTISGWSDSIYRVVPQLLNGSGSMIEEVNKISLDK